MPDLKTDVGLLARAAEGGVVTSDVARKALGLDGATTTARLRALESRGWLRRLRRGAYLVLPLEADPSRASTVEDPWLLGKVLLSPCYVGGWSAAEFWGLTEQLFRSTFIVSAANIRSSELKVGGAEFRIAKVSPARVSTSTEVWRGKTRVRVSDREHTIADALASPSWVGGLRHLAGILSNYSESEAWNPNALMLRLRQNRRKVAYKRLGYLAEKLSPNLKVLADESFEERGAGVVALDPSLPMRGKINSRWGLRINTQLTLGDQG